MRLGGGEHEDGLRRRLLERLQEGVPGLFGQHVRLVEDVDLPAAAGRGVGDALAQVADVVDGAVGGGVHLDHVDRGAGGDRHAGLAFAAGGDRRAAALAVERAGEDLRHRGLAGAARADEEVGVVDLVLLDRVAQRADHVLLAHDLVEGARAVASIERGRLGHRGLEPVYPRPGGASGVSESRAPIVTLEAQTAPLGEPPPVPCARAIEALQPADAGRLGRRGDGGAAARLPGRLPQLRHDLRPRLGPRTGARGQPRLRLRPAPHAAPADRPDRAGDDAARRRRDHGDDGHRLRLAGPDRLLRLPPRQPLVRPLDRRRRRRDRPHPRPLPLQRPARLHRPPLHRPLPRRPDRRGQAPPRRLARPRPPRPRRPAPPRGLAVLLRLPGSIWRWTPIRGTDETEKVSLERADTQNAGLSRPAFVRARDTFSVPSLPANRACRRRPDPLAAVRRNHHRQLPLLPDRHPGNGGDAETPHRPGRRRPLRPARARRSAAVAGDGRRARRRRPRLRLPAPALGARHRRRRARARRLRTARRRRPGDHRPLHDAGGGDPGDLRRPRPARLAPARARPPLAPPLAALRRPGRADVPRLAAEPVGPRLARRHRPHQPGRDRVATSPTWSTPAPSSPSAARSPSPTTAPSPASPSAST